jgi:hypothetical protein
MDAVPPLSDAFINRLVAEFTDAAVIGLLLVGSHARGDASPHSDVDLIRFTAVLPETEAERYTLTYRGGHLVSLSTATVAAKLGELSRPETAIWAVPGLRQAHILLDRQGELASLLQAAHRFRWEPLQAAADAYASYNVMGLAEEVHKILGALGRDDLPAALYGAWGLMAGLTRVVLVQRGVLIRTENAYFQQVQEAAGLHSRWTRAFRVAVGFETASAPLRAAAALRLYSETAALLVAALQPQHEDVIQGALGRIRSAGLLPPGE